MSRKCNLLSLDEEALMRSLTRHGERVLESEARRLAEIMKHEARMTTHGGAPGKPDWREEIAQNIGISAKGKTADSISVDVGYEPTSLAEKVRARVVAHGSGDKAEGGGSAIHAGPTGRLVWGGDLSEKRPSRAQTVYPLPSGFNQKGNRFVTNAMRRLQTQFGDRVQLTFSLLPGVVYHGKVRVNER